MTRLYAVHTQIYRILSNPGASPLALPSWWRLVVQASIDPDLTNHVKFPLLHRANKTAPHIPAIDQHPYPLKQAINTAYQRVRGDELARIGLLPALGIKRECTGSATRALSVRMTIIARLTQHCPRTNEARLSLLPCW